MAYTNRKNNVFECGGQHNVFRRGERHFPLECSGQRFALECGERHLTFECGGQRAVPTSARRIFGKAGQ